MAGHSKWANIKHKKGANDAKRSNIFTKMSRLLSSAVHEGGGMTDPEKNFRLRLAIDRAKAVNMPKDTIQRAIDKAGGGEDALMKNVMYEGFGPGGCALLISATTDNPNRTHADVKHVLDKNGAKIGGQNSVAYLFTQCGVVEIARKNTSESSIFAFFDNIGGIDLEETEESYIVYIPFENIGRVKEFLTDSEATSIDVYYKPESDVHLDAADESKLKTIVEALEDLDDVINVYTNAE